MEIAKPESDRLKLAEYHLILAWVGDVLTPRQALIWIEGVCEAEEPDGPAEFHDTGNLRRHPRMLAVFAGALDKAAHAPGANCADTSERGAR